MNLKSLSHNMKFKKLLRIFVLCFILFLFLFGRTFMGLYIFEFRLGEILIGLASIIFIFFTFYDFTKFQNLNFIFLLILIHFIFMLFYYKSGGFNLYLFKTSSYIWVLGSFYLAKKFKNVLNSEKFIYILFLVLVVNFFVSIFGINNEIQIYLANFTDKVDYLKASDLIIFFLFSSFVFLEKSQLQYKNKLITLVLFTSFYLPLILFKSRGSSLGMIFFIIIIFYELFKQKIKNYTFFKIIIFMIFLFIISTFIVSKTPVSIEEIDERVIIVTTGRFSKPLSEPTEIDYPFIYFEESRVFSGDGNVNWRLQIWQDVIHDLIKQNKLFIGYGYYQKIPAMDNVFRAGNDGTNENVHNFFINLIARGGLIHLFLYLLFFIIVYLKLKIKNNSILFLLFIVPLLLTSMFDASMENAHFPLLFYFLLGKLEDSKIKINLA